MGSSPPQPSPLPPPHAEHPWTTEHSPGGRRSRGGTARSPGGGGGRSPGSGGGGGMAAAGGGNGPGREGGGGGAGTPSPGAAGAPLELGVEERQCQVWGGDFVCPHSLNTATCPMPGRGATHAVTMGRTPQRLCIHRTSPFPALVPQFPHRGPSLGWAFALEISTAQHGESPAPQTRVFHQTSPAQRGDGGCPGLS